MTVRYCRVLLVLLIAGGLPQDAAAQITVRAEDFTRLVGQENQIASFTSEDQAELQGAVDATGENQTYDLSQAAISDTLYGSVAYSSDPNEHPAGEDFPNSNLIMAMNLGANTAGEDSTIWVFNRIGDEALYTLGGAFVFENPETGETDTLSFEYDPARLNFPLPVTYGDNWIDTTSFFGSEMIIDSEVEGWGTLITRSGSYDALRVRTTMTTSAFGFSDEEHYVDFITKNNAASVQITLGDDGQTAASAEIVRWSVGTASETDELPVSVRLSQNYPNPFNPATSFSYELEASRYVRLTVHDMLGRTVAVLADGLRPAGEHEVMFDASDLPSGTYLYRLRTEAGTLTRAMTVAK